MTNEQLEAHIKRFGGTHIIQMLRFSDPEQLT